MRPENWVPQGVDSLEDRALVALRETTQCVCVTAGAGAGKTEFLAQKAAYLLQTGLCPSPRRVLAISFKRDAALNLSERVRRRCPDEGHRFVSMTFDAFTKGIVDQFRDAVPEFYRPPANYQISFPTRDIIEDFLNRHDAQDVDWRNIDHAVSNTKLPLEGASLQPRMRGLLEAYWRDQFEGGEQAYLTFPMINRIVERMVRDNPHVRKALLATYPIVFLDEFQDTTTAQYEVLMAAFHGSRSVLTAVGDDKQRIMGWAGAMRDSFARFTADFNARPVTLLSNWRSHEDLVAIQHLIATAIDEDVEAVVARRPRQVDGDVAAIWQFRTREGEVEYLAEWIAGEVQDGQIEPHRIAILVRNYADRVEREILPAFAARNIALRNVARMVGGVAIQDLLSEELTECLIPFLRLGAKRRDREAWSQAQTQMQRLAAISDGDEVGLRRMAIRTEALCRTVRAYMQANSPEQVDTTALVHMLIDEIGEESIRQSTPSYSRASDFNRVRSGFVALLEECRASGGTWTDVLDRLVGKGQVPLMTVHKSKGLEFHTIVFFGLDNRSWWSLTPQNEEELNSFFVAFTRAEQRAFFTCCSERGGRIAWLERILGESLSRQYPGAE
ncbi:ATP-dependent helicase [Roseomonas sp. E05]|nr:ATP-dependent helicase [Roseomonas sp. E05]MDJ0387333.1 ATP-dependent helicase [Roseomonas sp. E05]